MDKYMKTIFTIIAVGIIVLNIQIFNNVITTKAHAVDTHTHPTFDIIGLSNHTHTSIDIFDFSSRVKRIVSYCTILGNFVAC